MLSANMGLLSITSAGTANANSPPQIASYLSTILSIGGIITGTMLTRKVRVNRLESAADVVRSAVLSQGTFDTMTFIQSHFLHTHSNSLFGLALIAVIASLPYALSTWFVAAFLLAIQLVIFQKTEVSSMIVVCFLEIALLACILGTKYGWSNPVSKLRSLSFLSRPAQEYWILPVIWWEVEGQAFEVYHTPGIGLESV